MKLKQEMLEASVVLMNEFCDLNQIPKPQVLMVPKESVYANVRACAWFRSCLLPTQIKHLRNDLGIDNIDSGPTISIKVWDCAHIGKSGPCWSYPGYVVDRTPYGVIQHEFGHYIDFYQSNGIRANQFSKKVYDCSKESPLTGYLGNHGENYASEWFAENFRLYMTNPDLCSILKPRFYNYLRSKDFKLTPIENRHWEEVLKDAPERTIQQTRKKIKEVQTALQ